MALVRFQLSVTAQRPAEPVWQALIDWPTHGDWIPATRVEMHSGDGGIETEFTATSGVWPLALPDRMRVTRLVPEAMTAEVAKLGPVITGAAGFTVNPLTAESCRIDWWEEVRVPRLPQLLAAPVAKAAELSFRLAIGRLVRMLGKNYLPGHTSST